MARPRGSTNKKATGIAAVKPTDNPDISSVQSNGPTAVEKRAYLEEYRNHRRRLADIMKEAAEEKGNGRSTLKAFENKGGSPKMLRRMWELTDMSKGEAEAEIAEYLGYAIDIGIRVTYDDAGQGGLADIMDQPTTKKSRAKKAAAPAIPEPTREAETDIAQKRARGDGWNSARADGVVNDNPYTAGSTEHQEWRKGFDEYVWEQENGRSPPPAAAPVGAGEGLPPDPA